MSNGSGSSSSTDEASRWVAGLNTFLSSERWRRRVAEFVDDHCWVFRDPEGVPNEYYSPKQHKMWMEFHSMAEEMLEEVLAELGGSMERLLKVRAFRVARGSHRRPTGLFDDALTRLDPLPRGDRPWTSAPWSRGGQGQAATCCPHCCGHCSRSTISWPLPT